MTASTMTTAAPSSPDTAIHSRALLVWLTISTWSARRYDKKVTEKVNADYHSATNAGRWNKFLLPGDCAAYKALTSIASSIRMAHYGHTLAWSDEGWRLLPTANYMPYSTWFREQQQAFNIALESFLTDYPAMKLEAQRLLNGQYRDEDYPSVMDLRKRFRLDVNYSPLPTVGDIRVNLADDQIEVIERNIQQQTATALQTATNDAWSRLHDVVTKIVERLSDPELIFRDSLIENAKEACAMLGRLNITNDPNLDAMRARVVDELTKVSPDVIRDNKIVRADVASKATDIVNAMSSFYGAE